MSVNEEALYFPSHGRRLFGFLHVPGTGSFPRTESTRPPAASENVPALSLVVCHPFGDEKKCSHRALAETARALAGAGVAVLRFDFTGCGDSGGDFRDATVTKWKEDVHSALDLLAERIGGGTRGLFGLRLGASIAALVAAERSDVQRLILWEPIPNGTRAFEADLRRKLIKQMMTDGTRGSRKEMMERLERGESEIDLDGFPIGGTLYRELRQVDLLGEDHPFRGEVLVVQISFNTRVGADAQRLYDSYSDAGADATLVPVAASPLWNRLELVDSRPLIKPTLEWLRARTA